MFSLSDEFQTVRFPFLIFGSETKKTFTFSQSIDNLFMIWHYGNVTLPLNMLATGLSENMISNHALSLAAALTLKYFFIQFLLLDALNSRPQCTMEPLVSERPLQKLKIPRKYPHQSSLWSRRIPDYF